MFGLACKINAYLSLNMYVKLYTWSSQPASMYITKRPARVLLGNDKAQRAWNVDSEVVVRYNTARLPLPDGSISSLFSN
jgi:hypothetical protein